MSNSIAQYLAAANAFVGFTEQGGPNAGQVVEAFLASVGLQKGQPWCAAFVNYVGQRTFSVLGKSTWPVPMAGGCAYLGSWATQKKILRRTGHVGDLFLLHYPSMKRFAHIGILVAPVAGKSNTWLCIEGNTSGAGSREGWMVAKRERVINPADGHRFIRWADLVTE
jgi:hypothetical protein